MSFKQRNNEIQTSVCGY